MKYNIGDRVRVKILSNYIGVGKIIDITSNIFGSSVYILKFISYDLSNDNSNLNVLGGMLDLDIEYYREEKLKELGIYDEV